MNLQPLRGQHHVSAITAHAKQNYNFYTKTLGMRLVKKTVNQDNTSMYHLFYADERGSPGTDLTFFEIPSSGPMQPGTNAVTLTSLRVADDASLTSYWMPRLDALGVNRGDIDRRSGRAVLAFRDPEGQRLALVSDETDAGVAGGRPWDGSPVPARHGIVGLGPVTLTVSRPDRTASVLTEIMGFREKGRYPAGDAGQPDIVVYETGEGGTGAEVHLETKTDGGRELQGSGSVHHVAFRVDNEAELRGWVQRLNERGISNSGFVERYYFRSLYFREPNGILFELATDGPGFEGDEPFERLGQRLSLPPYFEPHRNAIESRLAPLDTHTF